ncbi:replication-relaxation family protein [Alicyclobacillus sp. SP_1]|uniref:replication-relaxation family protein n=1 Tax=Alicyclobacillus sp. SP_1 TaxID=2942475 RepID=UPI002157AF29|nr:replication-relaxation family protein [Alicyclobacillus sp. SP_1]
MILNWANGEFTDTEKVIGTLFDAGVLRRKDLMLLLGWRRSKTDSHLLKLRQKQMLLTSRDSHGQTVYMLDENGVRAAHQLCNIEGKIVTMKAQISHQLGVNDILLRYVKAHGCEGVQWYSTRESADELFSFRKIAGNTDAEIRKSYIRPDALIQTANRGIFWLEYDNATESSRQLRKKFALYVQNLSIIDEKTKGQVRRVIWVAPTIERVRWLVSRWQDVKERRQAANIAMLFYIAGQETSYMAGERDKRRQTE